MLFLRLCFVILLLFLSELCFISCGVFICFFLADLFYLTSYSAPLLLSELTFLNAMVFVAYLFYFTAFFPHRWPSFFVDFLQLPYANANVSIFPYSTATVFSFRVYFYEK